MQELLIICYLLDYRLKNEQYKASVNGDFFISDWLRNQYSNFEYGRIQSNFNYDELYN